MPAKEPLFRQRFIILLHRVEDHLHDALYVAISRRQSSNINAKASRDCRSHLFFIEVLSLDLVRFKNFLGQAPRRRLFTAGFAVNSSSNGRNMFGHGSSRYTEGPDVRGGNLRRCRP
jgi:hypothetical protein